MPDETDQPIGLACPHCGYNVAIIPGNRCPECGGEFDRGSLLRRRAIADDAPRLWRPLAVVLCVPIAWGCLIVLSGHALGLFGAIFAAPALAIILMTCLVATLAASDELVSVIHAHQIGVGQSRR